MEMTIRRNTAVMILTSVMMAALSGGAAAYRLIEHREWTLPSESGARFILSNTGGAIEVIGWDRDEIEISATIRIRAASKDKARRIYGGIDFETDSGSGSTSIRALIPGFRKDSLYGEGNTAVSVDYSIRVPYSTELEIRSVTGDIAVIGVGGAFLIVSGQGSIDMRSRGGEGTLRTGSGDIGCELDFLPAGGKLRLKTGNGDVSLGIPADTSAMLRARTGTGAVRVRLEMTGVEKSRRRVKKGMLGGGDGEIVLESASGDVTVGGL